MLNTAAEGLLPIPSLHDAVMIPTPLTLRHTPGARVTLSRAVGPSHVRDAGHTAMLMKTSVVLGEGVGVGEGEGGAEGLGLAAAHPAGMDTPMKPLSKHAPSVGTDQS